MRDRLVQFRRQRGTALNLLISLVYVVLSYIALCKFRLNWKHSSLGKMNWLFSHIKESVELNVTEKGKAHRKHSLHGKIVASVLLKPFISGYERYHTADAP